MTVVYLSESSIRNITSIEELKELKKRPSDKDAKINSWFVGLGDYGKQMGEIILSIYGKAKEALTTTILFSLNEFAANLIKHDFVFFAGTILQTP